MFKNIINEDYVSLLNTRNNKTYGNVIVRDGKIFRLSQVPFSQDLLYKNSLYDVIINQKNFYQVCAIFALHFRRNEGEGVLFGKIFEREVTQNLLFVLKKKINNKSSLLYITSLLSPCEIEPVIIIVLHVCYQHANNQTGQAPLYRN